MAAAMNPPDIADDRDWMAAAARLSQRGIPLSAPNPSVGCIIVRGGRVLARGWTQQGGRPHAEAHALTQLGSEDCSTADIFVTLEPCAHRSKRGPSCADLLAEAAPRRVIIGQADPDPRTSGKGVQRLQEAGIEVCVIDDATARASLAGYLTQHALGRPFVTLKLAISADGFIAREPGEEQWITGEVARAHVHSRRAKQDAILVGGGTWRADNPRLDVRLAGLEARSPQRYILSKSGAGDKARSGIDKPRSCVKTGDIFQMEGVSRLYIEGGAETARSFMADDLVDRIELYSAPIKIGKGIKAPDAVLPGALAGWDVAESCQLGSDRFTAYQRNRN